MIIQIIFLYHCNNALNQKDFVCTEMFDYQIPFHISVIDYLFI